MSWKTRIEQKMLYTYDYFFAENVCRICWRDSATRDLLSNSNYDSFTIADKFKECIGVDLTMNSYPKKICVDCAKELDNFYAFKKFCQSSEQELAELHKGELEIKIVDTLTKTEEISESFYNLTSQDDDLKLEHVESIDDVFDDLNLEDTGSIEAQSTNIDVILPAKKGRKEKNPYYCTTCKIDLESLQNFEGHNLECHGIENGLYKCYGCKKLFTMKRRRMRHETICSALKNGYECVTCNKFLPKRSVIERHLIAHGSDEKLIMPDEPFACKKCFLKFDTMQLLKQHSIVHMTEKRNWVCDLCGRVFSRRDYWRKHAAAHAGRRAHACPHCDFRAVQRSSLTIHLRRHTGERPYSCDLCPQRCVTKSNLRKHLKRHLGIKEFKCKLCDKKYGYKMSLKEHMSATHDCSERHACADCGATYSRAKGLRRHQAAKHGTKKIKEFEPNVDNKVDSNEKLLLFENK